MPVLQPKITIDLNDILQLVAQLETPELEQFSQKISLLFAERKIELLPTKEIELLKKTRLCLSASKQQQYDTLAPKIENRTANLQEQEQFLELNKETEALNLKRMKALIELSQIRNVSLDELMLQLELTPTHA